MGSNLLEIGKSGIFSSRKALQTTAHNISNVNTEGFSRQRALIETNTPIGDGNIMMGQGSNVKSVKRMHSEFIQSRLQDGLTQKQYFSDRYRFLEGLENIFNEINQGGLHLAVSNFFNNFKDLANRPENDTVRGLVRDSANTLVQELHFTNDRLDETTKHVDRVSKEAINDINSLLESVSNLNVKIKEIESMHGETGDLRDQRDLSIDELSKYFALNTYRDENDMFTINAKGVGTLVSGGKINSLSTGHIVKNGVHSQEVIINNIAVTHKFQGGTIRAIHEIKSGEIKQLKNKMDEIAYHLAHSVNAVHRRGHAHQGARLHDGSSVEFKPRALPLSGINFFKEPLELHRASEYIDLSDEVKDDINNIVSALSPNSPGDNRVALAISKIKEVPIVGNKETQRTLEEDFLQTLGSLSLVTSKTKVNMEQAEGILAQTKNIKERISGVSLDEETANMLQLQQAYDASAKMLRVADEMFKTIIEMKR